MCERNNEKEIAALQRRLKREKSARVQAEALLTEKSDALFEALQQSKATESRLRLAMWAAQESYWEWDARADHFSVRTFSLHSARERQRDCGPFDLLHRMHDDDIHHLQFQWALILHGGEEYIDVAFRYRIRESYLWMRLRGRVLERDENESAIRIVGTTRDITQEREAEQSFHLMASAFASSREPMLVLASDYTINECNSAFLSLIGETDKKQVVGLSLRTMIAESDQYLTSHLGQQVRFESMLRINAVREQPVDVSLSRFESQHQKRPYFIATIRDISERRVSERRLRQMAMHDDLTGLRNRNGLNEALQDVLVCGEPFTILFIDLDGFKLVNDSAGHETGDRCLKQVSNVLRSINREDKIVTRWGGDEFVVLLPCCDEKCAHDVSEDIILGIEGLKFDNLHIEAALSASIGLACYPRDDDSAERLIQNADAAMYQAKITGKGRVSVYQKGLWESMKAQVSLLSELRKTIELDGLDFLVQGKYDIQGVLQSGEVLCRWHSAMHGNVSPSVFIALAEAHKLDSEIGLQALSRACEYLRVMDENGFSVPLAVNISASQLLDPMFPQEARSICDKKGIVPRLIEIELTESIFMQDEAKALAALSQLRQIGFSLALDDFGCGFSALSYLKIFDFDTVKLDRSLLKDIHYNKKGLSLFQGIIAMLQQLNIHTVVEGVELAEYLPLLRQANVDLLQGFYFDEPAQFSDFMSRVPTSPRALNKKGCTS